ncbi:hypothetical protein Scep_016552 [Stephania cephalantha]|uniref:Uncharacterized protein n=1 Tax=Stephania cephalantha TaxID=152367 RepID=A0AAP0IMV5_9MAGN
MYPSRRRLWFPCALSSKALTPEVSAQPVLPSRCGNSSLWVRGLGIVGLLHISTTKHKPTSGPPFQHSPSKLR